MGRIFIFLLLLLGICSSIFLISASDATSIGPGSDTRCPVCGMFVSKYPNWIAQIEFQDESTVFFDGPKDMFRYLLDIPKYQPESAFKEIAGIFVSEYYGSKRIEARTAFYVIGSDINGPMGMELVPFDAEAAAVEFKSDHRGEEILRFQQVDQSCIRRLR